MESINTKVEVKMVELLLFIVPLFLLRVNAYACINCKIQIG